LNVRENSVSKIRWIIKEFELDTQPIRARLVNKANTTRAGWQEFFLQQSIFPSLFKRQTLE